MAQFYWVVFAINMSPPFPLVPPAGILVIGEEILSGSKSRRQNARYLVRELRGLGWRFRRNRRDPDEIDEIAEAVRGMSSRYDHVFTSGGVGPTHDDVTMAAMAKAFGAAPERAIWNLRPRFVRPWDPKPATSAICAWQTSLTTRDCCTARTATAKPLGGCGGEKRLHPARRARDLPIQGLRWCANCSGPALSFVARFFARGRGLSSPPPSTRWWPSFPAWRSDLTLGSGVAELQGQDYRRRP